MNGGRGGSGWCARLSLILLLGAAAPGASDAQPDVAAVAADTRLGDSPVTVRLANIEKADAGGIAVLLIEGIQGRSVQPIRINVFVDKPDAGPATPTTDPNCVGFLQLLPRSGVVRKTGAILDVSALVSRARDRPIGITLVPVVGTDSQPKGVDLAIGRMLIRNEPQ